VRDKKGNLLTDNNSMLCTSKSRFCRLYKLHGINNVMKTKILAAESLAQLTLCGVPGLKIWY
jgi:hypothetical protein